MKNKILLGTSNIGKLKEFQFYLEYFKLFPDYKFQTLADFKNIREPIENGKSFEENASIKSNFFYKSTKIKCLCDDSGFIVDELNNFPGIKTARVAKKLGNEQNVIKHIFSKFANKSELKATFFCALALIGEGEKFICLGKVGGKVIPEGRGNRGFGYDPYFIPTHQTKTFAEMDREEKMLLSHRFNAFEILTNQKL